MKLYFSRGACSLSPHIVLHELGLKHEAVRVDLANRSDDFKKANPKGEVPTLMTDKGQILTEGVAIVQYLADQKPEGHLMPKAGTWERYKALEWLNYITAELHKGFSPLFRWEKMVPNPEGQKQLKDYVVAQLGSKFDFLTENLKGKQYLMGDQFTVCDAYLYTILTWTKKLDMSKWPELMAYAERVQNRPATQAAMKMEASA